MMDTTDDRKTKAAPPSTENAASKIQHANDSKSTNKWRTTLKHLLRGPRHRFQGELWGDHALHSTVSTLKRYYGLEVARDWTEIPNRFGTRTRVKRYWIAEQSRALAYRLLSGSAHEGGAV